MTLVAPRKPHHSQRKRTGRHQHRHKNFAKTYWPYLPIGLIVTAGFVLNSLWPSQHSVLGYATDMSVSELLSDTNSQRSAHGEAGLHLNSLLDRAAQNKAADMASKDYWSHNSPSGKTPWDFITAAGYKYQTAGENLAYGFATSADTVTGWMNSPEHRANILNTSYKDVGFGIINIPNYQGDGPQTLVVAMYASPATVASSAPTSSSHPAASQPIQTSTLKQSTPVASTPASPTKAEQPKKPTPKTTTKQDTVTPTNIASQPKDELPQQKISRIQLTANGENEWSMMATLVIVTVALALLIVRHGLAWHRLLNRSERFVLKHPALDMVATSVVVVAVVLSQTSGVIR
jgi:uncharacterized protein YkwD